MNWLLWLTVVRWTIRIAMVPVIIRRRLPPSTSIAWLAVIFLLPIVGLIIYLLIGSQVLGHKRRRRYRHAVRQKSMQWVQQTDDGLTSTSRDRTAPIKIQTERLFGMPGVDGNEVQFLSQHEQFIDSLVRDIDAAEHHVHLLFYIFETDATGQLVADALARACARSVRCRVLVDAAGSRTLLKRRALGQNMIRSGVELRTALPVSRIRRRLARIDLRNHRKLVVVDGSIAYTGSHNIINKHYERDPSLETYDLSARFRGPVVTQLQSVFAEDWTFETGKHFSAAELFPKPSDDQPGCICVQTVPSGPDEDSRTFRRVLLTALNSARETLILTTPYFVPDEHTMMALSMAAYRGVETHVIVAERTDYAVVSAAGRSYFGRLLDYGVNVHLFPDGMLHAKSITIDDACAVIGTSNIDIRSLVLNFELNAIMYGSDVTNAVRDIQIGYRERARALDPATWKNRPVVQAYVDHAAALLSPLL